MSKDIEEALIKATGSLKNDAGKPRDVYCPEFGWIILNGNTTAVYKEWLLADVATLLSAADSKVTVTNKIEARPIRVGRVRKK